MSTIEPRRAARVLIPSSLLLVITLPGCSTSDVMASAPDGGADSAPLAEIELAIVSPISGSAYVRDFIGEHGALVARVELEVQASGPYSWISFDIVGMEALGNPGADLVLPAEFRLDGTFQVTATAYDAAGQVATTDAVELTIEAPAAGDCYDWLDLYNIEYSVGPSRPGVAEPVTVVTPINGMAYRYVANDNPRQTVFMDCNLAVSLARTASSLRERDIIEVADIGIYNYRCIGNVGTPPDCPQGISQHAYANAIDLAGFTSGDGTYYSVNSDWIIDPDGEGTCATATEPGKDEFLHELICQQKAEGIWNIVLTPNYNTAHRDHFHVDLTPGGNSIHRGALDVGFDDY
jgi:hypothetical protein